MTSIAEVLTAKQSALGQIATQQIALKIRTEELRDKLGYGSPLTPSENKEWDAIEVALAALSTAELDVHVITAQALSDSSELARLKNVIADTSTRLTSKLNSLKATVAALNTAATVISAVASVAAKVGGLAFPN